MFIPTVLEFHWVCRITHWRIKSGLSLSLSFLQCMNIDKTWTEMRTIEH